MKKLKLSESPFYLLLFLFVLLPFNAEIIPPFIILITLTALIFGDRAHWKSKFITSIPFTLPLLVLYIWATISILWTEHLDATLKDLEHKLSLIVFPIVIPLIKLKSTHLSQLLRFFVISCTIVALVCLSGTFYKVIFNVPPVDGIDFSAEFAIKDGFGQVHSLFMHRSYYAMYLCVSIWYVLKAITKRTHLQFNKSIKFYIVVLTILVLGVLFSESKTGLISLFALIILFLVDNYKNITKKMILLFFVTIFAFGFIFKNILFERFQNIYDGYTKPFDVKQVYNANSTGARIKLWETSLEVIKKKPILGHGFGTSKETIRKRNLEKGYTLFTMYNRSYNTHNQFLEMWIEIGIIGFLLFLTFFVGMLYKFEKTSIFIFGIYTLFIINYFTEVILDRQTGVILVAVLTCLMPVFKNEKLKFIK